jgi:holin-like protein
MSTAAFLQKIHPGQRLSAPLQAVVLILGFSLLSLLLESWAPKLNPALTGFAVLLAALSSRLLPLSLVEHGAKLLIAQSALFLIPPVVAVARQSALLEAHWLALLVIVVGGTAASAAATAIAVEVTTKLVIRGQA